MARYAWLVTKDHINHDEQWNREGTMGPRSITPEQRQMLEAGHGSLWKTWDDDDILYYEGRIVGDFDGHEPLDDFAKPDAGAVKIKVEDNDTLPPVADTDAARGPQDSQSGVDP